MVKKRKKRKPKKRARKGPASLASAAGASASGLAPAGDDDAGEGGDLGLSARGLLLDALTDTSSRGGAGGEEADEPASRGRATEEDAEPDEGELDESAARHELPDRPVEIPLMGAGGSDDEDEEDEEDEDEDEEDEEEAPSSRAGAGDDEEDEEYEDDDVAAAQMGSARYVIFGFFALWLVAAYVAGQSLMSLWGYLAHRDWFMSALPAISAVPHEGELISRSSVSLVLGGLIAGLVVLYYYLKADVRQWADEVAEQLGKVKWPTRKEVGNHTVVVLAVAAVLTTILALLDRFWGFVTNLIYASGL